MNSRVTLVVVLVAVGVLVGAGSAVAADAGPFEPESVETEEIDADETRLDVSLQENGTAEWTVEYRMRLDDDESVDAFETLRDDVDENPEAYTDAFADRIDATVETAGDATDREMSAEGYAVDTSRQTLGPEYGVVTYSFRWYGFAAVEGEELHAGDAIDRLYLDDDTRLSVGWPEPYEFVSASPDPDDRRDRVVIWHGSDTDFVSGEPRVVVSTGGFGVGHLALGVALLAVVAIAIGGAWWYRTRAAANSDDPADGGEPASPTADPDEPDSRSDSGSGPDPRDDLLSNEEQVLGLLEEYDGRMKQQTVVEELEWSDAKTSKVVRTLHEEGKLESFRLGRENVLTLPEDDADADPRQAADRND